MCSQSGPPFLRCALGSQQDELALRVTCLARPDAEMKVLPLANIDDNVFELVAVVEQLDIAVHAMLMDVVNVDVDHVHEHGVHGDVELLHDGDELEHVVVYVRERQHLHLGVGTSKACDAQCKLVLLRAKRAPQERRTTLRAHALVRTLGGRFRAGSASGGQ